MGRPRPAGRWADAGPATMSDRDMSRSEMGRTAIILSGPSQSTKKKPARRERMPDRRPVRRTLDAWPFGKWRSRHGESPDSALQLFGGPEPGCFAPEHVHRLSRAGILSLPRLATRHPECPEAHERHRLSALERHADRVQQCAEGAVRGGLGPSA